MWSRHLVRVCAAGFGVALLAGCGGSSSKTTSTAGGNPTSPSSSPVAPATPASEAHLREIALQAADLPKGWKGTPHKTDPSNSATQATLAKCVGVRNTYPDMVASAHSRDFALGGAGISSSATTYRSQSDLDADVAMMHSPKLSPCYEQLIKERLATTLPKGATIDAASLTFTPGSAGGPANVVATGTGTIKVTANGKQVAIYQNLTFITDPLIQAQVVAGSFGTPVPPSFMKPLVAAVATRAAKG
jgi:hypothetical protein